MSVTTIKSIVSYKIDYRGDNLDKMLKDIEQCFPALNEAKRKKFASLILSVGIPEIEVAQGIGPDGKRLTIRFTNLSEDPYPKMWWAECGRLGVTQILTQDDKTYTLVFDI